MKIRLFTLPFDQETQRFPDELVESFCANKKVDKIKSKFFEAGGQSFWTVAIHYENLPSKTFSRQLKDLDESQQVLFEQLANWRKEQANQEAIIRASYAPRSEQESVLRSINLDLEQLRFYMRLCKDKQYISLEQYRFASEELNTCGKLCGGWIKKLRQ